MGFTQPPFPVFFAGSSTFNIQGTTALQTKVHEKQQNRSRIIFFSAHMKIKWESPFKAAVLVSSRTEMIFPS